MSIEHDQSTRKAMRTGISGENVLRPLDEFSVVSSLDIAAQIEADILAWVTKKAESARPSPDSMITGTGRFQQNMP